MISIYMIITALVPVALAKGSMECNLSGPTAAQQCFGVLGEQVIFHLPTDVTMIILKKIKKSTILYTKKAAVHIHADYINRSAFFTNGTFKLNDTQKTDSGDYELQTFQSDGILLHKVNIHLEIQAPVSKLAVSQMCLSPEQMNISCSSMGDGVEFILTLDGLLLMQTKNHSLSPSCSTVDTIASLSGSTDNQHKSSVSNVTISLHGQLTGNLMCNARNNISGDETVIQLTRCKGSISHFSLVTVAVTASVATLLLHLALFLGIKHFNKKTPPTTVNDDHTEDEIIYSDVKILKSTRKTRPNLHQNAN